MGQQRPGLDARGRTPPSRSSAPPIGTDDAPAQYSEADGINFTEIAKTCARRDPGGLLRADARRSTPSSPRSRRSSPTPSSAYGTAWQDSTRDHRRGARPGGRGREGSSRRPRRPSPRRSRSTPSSRTRPSSTATSSRPTADGVNVYTATRQPAAVPHLARHGAGRRSSTRTPRTTSAFFIPWSAERADELEADVFVTWVPDEKTVAQIEKDPLLGQIPAIERGSLRRRLRQHADPVDLGGQPAEPAVGAGRGSCRSSAPRPTRPLTHDADHRPARTRPALPARRSLLAAWRSACSSACLAVASLASALGDVDPATLLDALARDFDAADGDHAVVLASRVPRTVVGLAGRRRARPGRRGDAGRRPQPARRPGHPRRQRGRRARGRRRDRRASAIDDPGGYVWFAFAGAALAAVVVYAVASLGRDGRDPRQARARRRGAERRRSSSLTQRRCSSTTSRRSTASGSGRSARSRAAAGTSCAAVAAVPRGRRRSSRSAPGGCSTAWRSATTSPAGSGSGRSSGGPSPALGVVAAVRRGHRARRADRVRRPGRAARRARARRRRLPLGAAALRALLGAGARAGRRRRRSAASWLPPTEAAGRADDARWSVPRCSSWLVRRRREVSAVTAAARRRPERGARRSSAVAAPCERPRRAPRGRRLAHCSALAVRRAVLRRGPARHATPCRCPTWSASSAGADIPGATFIVLEDKLPRARGRRCSSGVAFGVVRCDVPDDAAQPARQPGHHRRDRRAPAPPRSSRSSCSASPAAVVVWWRSAAPAVVAVAHPRAVARRSRVSGSRLILVGIGIGGGPARRDRPTCSPAPTSDVAAEALVWLNGSLNGSTWAARTRTSLVALAVVLPPLPCCCSRGLDGPGARRRRRGRARRTASRGRGSGCCVVAVALAAVATAAAGPVAFVAFLSGPIARRLLRGPARRSSPSALVGALVVLVADFVAAQRRSRHRACRSASSPARSARRSCCGCSSPPRTGEESLMTDIDCLSAEDLSLAYDGPHGRDELSLDAAARPDHTSSSARTPAGSRPCCAGWPG